MRIEMEVSVFREDAKETLPEMARKYRGLRLSIERLQGLGHLPPQTQILWRVKGLGVPSMSSPDPNQGWLPLCT